MKTIRTILLALMALVAMISPTTRDAMAQAGPGGFTLEQTLSDEAQRTTIAFSGLAMMTGNLEAQSFFPPGKVADYTGFQYLRDNDPDNMGHNTSFLTRVANNVIYILNDAQFSELKTLATAQLEQIDLYGYKRFPLMKAFRRLLDGDIPSGATGLDLEAVKAASRELYILDGQISFDRALLYANLLASMDASQKAYLDAMKGKGWSSWPDVTNEQVRDKMAGLPQGTAVAVMTYASDLFSWYAGSVEADVYFCPERQGTYYGGFYIKDAPAIGHEGYSIDEQLTATAGAALSDPAKGYVTADQAAAISSLVDVQRSNLYASPTSSIVAMRTQIATLLRGLLVSTANSEAVRTQVLALSGVYGELDGENNYHYATTFAQVHATLTSEQTTRLAALRKSIMSGTYSDGTPFDFSVCTTPYLYSAPIADLGVLEPYLSNTDYLFGTSGSGSGPTAAFTYTPAAPAAGQTVVFSDASTGAPTAWAWTFGDGGSSVLQSPTHAYSTAGTFTVTLVASNAAGTSTTTKTVTVGSSGGSFALTSAAAAGGTLPAEYTCDGSGASPALSWSNPPSGTTGFALMMTTRPPDGSTKWSWVLYGIPFSTSGLAKNGSAVGTLGATSRGVRAYDPPCSQGPGPKQYTFTVYALSGAPAVPAVPEQVTGAVLTEAIASITLGSASLTLTYTRPTTTTLAAAFSFTPAAPTVGQTVEFKDTSTGGPTSWAWTFGDGVSSTAQSPSHAFGAAGTYTATLVASNASGSSTATRAVTVTASGAASLAYPVVDTGQTACYGATGGMTCPVAGQPFCGQDAQLHGNQPSYTTSADGLTVRDTVTGLTWQRSADTTGDGVITSADKLTWTQAQARPAALNTARFGGYSDWRLPTIKELYSLIDFRGTDPSVGGTDTSGLVPFLDPTYFRFSWGDTAAGERIIDAQYWSSTPYVATTMGGNATVFGVNFADGRIKGYPRDVGPRGAFTEYLLCVRGSSSYGVNDLVDNGDGTVTDRATGLMWARSDSGLGMTWEEALAWVQARNAVRHLGYADWRLPNAKELQSIVDYTRSPATTSSPAIDAVFSCTPITNEAGQADFPSYWTGTTHVSSNGSGAAGVYIAFGRAMGYMNGTWQDVHGAGAQRSDPKAGNPADYPTGRGPQGDAIRIYNHVRPVRDAVAPAARPLVLPAVAHLRGVSATFFSRLEVLNTGAAALTVEVVYTPRADIGGAARTTTLTLAPGVQQTVDDPLGTWFGFGAAEKAVGSLSFTVTSGTSASLLVQSVITARNDDGREYGQDLPAIPAAQALAAGATAYLGSLVDPTRTRINLAAMALDDGTVLTVQPVDPIGAPLAAARTLTLGAGGSVQLNDLHSGAAGFGLGSAADYLLEVKVSAGRAVAYASVLDGTASVGGTSDPTTLLPVVGGATTVTLLELGPIQGTNEFAGSAQIANLSASAAEVSAELHLRGVPGVAATATLTIPAGDTLGYADLVGELFHTSGLGTVVLRASNGTQIMATGREYAVLRDGTGAVSGTAGQLIPGMVDDELLQVGSTYHLLGLRQRTLAAGLERSHLAAYNPGSQTATVTVALIDGATGIAEGTTTLAVRAGELVRLNNVISAIHPGQDGGSKRLAVTTDLPVFVKAFRVNPWGDPVTVDALIAQ